MLTELGNFQILIIKHFREGMEGNDCSSKLFSRTPYPDGWEVDKRVRKFPH